MVDFKLGKDPAFIKGYTVDENNNLTVNCTDVNNSYTVTANPHNIDVINRKMEEQVLNNKTKISNFAYYYRIVMQSWITLVSMGISLSYPDRMLYTMWTALLLGLWCIGFEGNLAEIRKNKEILKAYKKYLYFIQNKKEFLPFGETDLDNTYIKINDIDELSLEDLELMVKGPIIVLKKENPL